jgi:hypothetical protein
MMTEEFKSGEITYFRTVYEHGGSRIWAENEKGNKKLIADTYSPKMIRDIFWLTIRGNKEILDV